MTIYQFYIYMLRLNSYIQNYIKPQFHLRISLYQTNIFIFRIVYYKQYRFGKYFKMISLKFKLL